MARRLHDGQAHLLTLTLTCCEREALVARELGDALGVTRASAHMYVERAKRRLGASTPPEPLPPRSAKDGFKRAMGVAAG